MTNKFGPTRKDLMFRLIFSVAGLALMIGTLLYRGLPIGAAGWEAIGISTVFFGGTLVLTLLKLIRKDYPDDGL
ncbi:MAG: hypothetical protein AAFY38_06705 [Pseudomonadota bacterium]